MNKEKICGVCEEGEDHLTKIKCSQSFYRNTYFLNLFLVLN